VNAFDLVNDTVLRVAGAYSDSWWTQISGTTRKHLRDAIMSHIKTGSPLSALVKDIEPLFGRDRAKMIATTEVTRLYAEGNVMAYKAGNVTEVEWRTVNDGRVDPLCMARHNQRYSVDNVDKPPIHPACRCWLAPVPPGRKTAITKPVA